MFAPKIIRNDAECRAAREAAQSCFGDGDAILTGKEELHALLVALIDTYERERYPSPEITSAFVLECTMDAKGWTQSRLAKAVGSAGITSEILSGKRDLSPGIIEKLAKQGMPIGLLTSFVPIKHRRLLAKFSTPASSSKPLRRTRPARRTKARV